MYLISPHKKQYKANLHCHSTHTDGKWTPLLLKEAYKNRGYQILAITDHEFPMSHDGLTDDDFLMLTGYEAHIRTNATGTFEPYNKEIHLNLFARNSQNETMICYHDIYRRFLDKEPSQMSLAGSQEPRRYERDYINYFIQTARENGYLVSYNHPYWSMESEADILAYEGYFAMEMCNYNSYISNHVEYNGALYDKMLLVGKRVFCIAGDDNHNKYPPDHPKSDSFGAFTMFMADELNYDTIIHAMENGEMYSSMGPMFHEVSFEGNRLHVECSEVASIHMYFGSKQPLWESATQGESLTSADFEIPKEARYVRISIFDKEGKAADTRGFSREELGMEPL